MPKVSLVRCEDYAEDKVCAAVKRSLDLIGGIENFVKPGMKVLLKPNLLSARPPEDQRDSARRTRARLRRPPRRSLEVKRFG